MCDQKVRLRGISSPELKTPAGARSERIRRADLMPGVQLVITATKVDLYDRCLSNIFYVPREQDPHVIARRGNYLIGRSSRLGTRSGGRNSLWKGESG